MKLIKEKVIEINTEDGPREYIISRFPATEGRRILSQYPLSALPKIGDYAINEKAMYELMKYVAVKKGEHEQRLISKDLIDNHVDSWETLMRIEFAMIEYNCTFFQNGKIWLFLEKLKQIFPTLNTKMSMDSSAQSSTVDKQRSKSSGRSTT